MTSNGSRGVTPRVEKSDARRCAAQGEAWLRLLRHWQKEWLNGTVLKSIRLKGLLMARTPVMLVVTRDGPEGPQVAFHREDDAERLWPGLLKRVEEGKLKWRRDEYASEHNQEAGEEAGT